MADSENAEELDIEEVEQIEEDDSDLRRRTFLERHDWIPWMAAAVLIGGTAGFFSDR